MKTRIRDWWKKARRAAVKVERVTVEEFRRAPAKLADQRHVPLPLSNRDFG